MAHEVHQPTLYTVLHNRLIARHTLPYLTIAELLNLAATCHRFRDLILHDAAAFRFLDLSTIQAAAARFEPVDTGALNWQRERIAERVSEEDLNVGPLRFILSWLHSRTLLQHVQTLVLDGLPAPAEVLHEIISEPRYQVRILSVVGSRHLNEAKFRKTLQYAVRPTRPKGTPRLQGVYIFGSESGGSDTVPPGLAGQQTASAATGNSRAVGSVWNHRSRKALGLERSSEPWYTGVGRVLPKYWGKRPENLEAWAATLRECEGIIHFDAVLCQGPKHFRASADADVTFEQHGFLNGAVASTAVEVCQKCRRMPEGPVYPRNAPSSRLPLLAPPPQHTASIARAQQPVINGRRALDIALYARCAGCLVARCCEACFAFWCEDCCSDEQLRTNPVTKVPIASCHGPLKYWLLTQVVTSEGAGNAVDFAKSATSSTTGRADRAGSPSAAPTMTDAQTPRAIGASGRVVEAASYGLSHPPVYRCVARKPHYGSPMLGKLTQDNHLYCTADTPFEAMSDK